MFDPNPYPLFKTTGYQSTLYLDRQQDLHWLPVRQCIDYKILLMVHNVLHRETSPSYLQEFLRLRSPTRRLLSTAAPWLLAILRTNGQYGNRSLGAVAPRLWNSLPVEMRCLTDTTTFKKNLKTLL
jgi:hypothetical protein